MEAGDKVRVLDCDYGRATNSVGKEGVIAEPGRSAKWRVWFGSGEYNYFNYEWDCYNESELEAIPHE